MPLSDFPDTPIPAAEFFEAFVPARFAAAGLTSAVAGFDIAWGVHLSGEGGGEWLYRLSGGVFGVSAGNCDDAAVDIVMEMSTLAEPAWSGGRVFDEQFESWLKGFQRRNGLKADGIIGPRTLMYLVAPTIVEPRLVLASAERS